jgi:DNA-binding beta-propeller fold protein YncE
MRRTGFLSVHAAALLFLSAVMSAQAPSLRVDPLWPKPLGNHWILGSVTGVRVDAQNHIWVTHRGLESLQNNEKGPTLTPWASECCFSAPQVLEFDQSGKLLNHWGGPGQGYDWPQNPSGLDIDAQGNIWIAAAGTDPAPAGRGRRGRGPETPPPPADAQVLKFSPTGQFQMQIGKPGLTSGSDAALDRPAAVAVDSAANEVFVADGYGSHHRVAVFDARTGAFKRQWGANGAKPFGAVTCVAIAKDGMVYVCDRTNNRVQVFQKNGTFVKEGVVSTTTKGDGAAWGVAFSSDPQQRFLFVADGQDKTVLILQRDTLAKVGSFGDGGRLPGRFYAVGSVAVDSQGNVYTGENSEGKRVQKWMPQGR